MSLARHSVAFQDQAGNAQPGVRVKITTLADASVSLFSDSAGVSPIEGNVVTTDSSGVATFYVVAGVYKRLTQQAGATGWVTEPDVMIGAPTDADGRLAGPQGSADIGHIASGAGSIERTVQAALRDWVSVTGKGAAGNGTTDDSAAFDALAATNGGYVPPGNYRITGTRTWPFDLLFAAGAKLTLDAGCTVTMTGRISAWGNRQIIYGAGSMLDMPYVNVAWFAGDKMGGTSNAFAELVKAYAACAMFGEIFWPGQFTTDGAAGVPVLKGQQTKGVGYFGAGMVFSGTACHGFAVDQTLAASFEGIGWALADQDAIATSGILVAVGPGAPYVQLRQVLARGGNIGFQFGAGGGKVIDFDLLDLETVGILMSGTNDVFVDDFIISSPTDRMRLTAITGTFAQGETLTGGTSGATGELSILISASSFKVFSNGNVNFQVGEVVTGATSGATGTVSVYKVPLSLGGIRLTEKAEAFIASNGDIIGGAYNLTTDATVNGVGTRPAYNKFSNIFFDSADNGSDINKAVEFDFISCWWSNRPNNGASLTNTDGMRFTGGGAINCAGHGVVVNSTAKNTHFTNFSGRGNSTKAANTYHGLFFNDAKEWTVKGGVYDAGLGFGQQAYGIAIASACDNFRIRDPNVRGNTTAGIFDGTPDTADKVIDAIGYTTRASGTGTVAVGQTVVQITHGLAATPRAQDIAVGFTTSPASSSVGSLYLAAIGATTFQIVTNTAVVTSALGVSWSARIKGA